MQIGRVRWKIPSNDIKPKFDNQNLTSNQHYVLYIDGDLDLENLSTWLIPISHRQSATILSKNANFGSKLNHTYILGITKKSPQKFVRYAFLYNYTTKSYLPRVLKQEIEQKSVGQNAFVTCASCNLVDKLKKFPIKSWSFILKNWSFGIFFVMKIAINRMVGVSLWAWELEDHLVRVKPTMFWDIPLGT